MSLRQVVVVVSTLVAVAGGGSARAVIPHREQPISPTFASNKAAAARASARVLTHLPVPPGSTRLGGEPADWPGEEFGVGPSDPSLRRTAYWSVPASAVAYRTYVRTHLPSGLKLLPGSSVDSHGVVMRTLQQRHSPRRQSFLPVTVTLQSVELSGRTLVRADTFTAAHTVRDSTSSVALSEIASVDLTVVARPNPPQGDPTTLTRTLGPADAAALARLVRVFDGLPGSIRPPFVAPCPFLGDPSPSDDVLFHLSDGSTVQAHLQIGCFGQVTVSRDGRRIHPSLDPGHLDRVVQSLVKGP